MTQNLKPNVKSSQTSMQSVTPIKQVNNYRLESKLSKTTQSYGNESSQTQWNWMHPNISENFYQKLEPPTNAEDARIKMSCHEHSVEDFNLQLQMNELETSMLCDGDEVLPYNVKEVEDLEQKKLKLLLGKRFHLNASRCYWYWLARNEK